MRDLFYSSANHLINVRHFYDDGDDKVVANDDR